MVGQRNRLNRLRIMKLDNFENRAEHQHACLLVSSVENPAALSTLGREITSSERSSGYVLRISKGANPFC